jgi:hypothetical protein
VIHIHDGEDLLPQEMTRGISLVACPHSHSIVPGSLDVMS